MRTVVGALVVLLVAGGLAVRAHGAEWDTIAPGRSTQEAVRARYGAPTKTVSQKAEGYDSPQWIYEAAQAPRGFVRAVFDFGLLTPSGYRADLLRAMRLEPRPGIFTRKAVLEGWGAPERFGKEKDADVFFYESGLLVYFAKDGWLAETMIFTPPQQPPAAAPRAKP